MYEVSTVELRTGGRTPQGVRGLKCQWSLVTYAGEGRTPQGVRGLKCSTRRSSRWVWSGRTPQGVRGLKFHSPFPCMTLRRSHPARGAWIEISFYLNMGKSSNVAPRKGCVD